jgi:hypothetical protein
VSEALTGPFAAAALVLCAAGAAKLRARSGARWVLLAPVELGVGAWCLVAPGRPAAASLAALYAALAAGALALARRREACGCFGEHDAPATVFQAALSGALALVALAAALAGAHGVAWVLGRSPATAAALIVGTAGCAYATVLAYTELPRAWGSWGAR